MSTGLAVETIIGALTDAGKSPRESGGSWSALCPAHDDHHPSLSVTGIEGQAQVHCFADCDTRDVMAALNLGLRDLYDEPTGATYRYDDGRVVHRTPEKRFHQTGATKGTAVLYRLPQVIEAVANGQTIYVVEGEKDVHALESVGVVATTSPMGAGNFAKVDASPLTGARVIIVGDNDKPGEKYASTARDILLPLGCTVEVVHAKVGKDAADHVAAGHTVGEFVAVNVPRNKGVRHLRVTRGSEVTTRRVL
jgi:DNA primase